MQLPLFATTLCQRRDLIQTVEGWLVTEWPSWYGSGGRGDVEKDVNAFAKSETDLPIGMVVQEGDQPVGVGALKTESISTHLHLGPWAAAGYVLPSHRGRGIGAFLLQALVARAKTLGFPHVYCGTSTSNSLLERSGWHLMEAVELQGKPLGVYRSAA